MDIARANKSSHALYRWIRNFAKTIEITENRQMSTDMSGLTALIRHDSVTARIQASVDQRPDATALTWIPYAGRPPQTRSYSAVWSRAHSIAHALRKAAGSMRAKGCTAFPTQPTVGLMVDEGPMLPVTMLGILLARMVIVPMDPNDPAPRLQAIADDAEPAIIVAQGPAAAAKARGLRLRPPPQQQLAQARRAAPAAFLRVSPAVARRSAPESARRSAPASAAACRATHPPHPGPVRCACSSPSASRSLHWPCSSPEQRPEPAAH